VSGAARPPESRPPLALPRIGLEPERRGLLALGGGAGSLLRRHDDHLHAPGVGGRRLARRRARDLGDFLLHVVGDEVAGELVLVALHPRLFVQLQHVVAIVELGALGEALDPLVDLLALLAEGDGRAVGDVGLIIKTIAGQIMVTRSI
jgi:hypothetical protein